MREVAFTPPSLWCQHPEWWNADDEDATEHEVSALVAAFVRAVQPELVVETGTYLGQTTEAIGRALAANGHGRLVSIEVDLERSDRARARCGGLPVQIETGDSTRWSPPGPIDFAWLDSALHTRKVELERLHPYFSQGAIVGVHDAAPHHPVTESLRPLVEQGLITPITLRTPRGVMFAQVR